MKGSKVFWILALSAAVIMLLAPAAFAGGFKYAPKKPHAGKDVTPIEAYEMFSKDPKHTFLIDVRTRPEYQMIGHPVGAYNIPLKFWSNKFKKKYQKVENPDFAKTLLAVADPKTDTLLLMCRSAKRSRKAADLTVKAGFPEDKVFNVMGGFEGDKLKNKNSVFNGRRKIGGWKNEGLPWTYQIDPKLIYESVTAKGAKK